jgi:hypothetical protein
VVHDAGPGELVETEGRGRGARRGERAVDLQVPPRGDVRNDGEHYRGRVLLRRRLERLRADHEPDVEQDRQDRDERHDREQQRGQAEEAHQRDHDAGRERVADPAAHRLPARMADVHRRRERAAEDRAGDRADAVRDQDLAQVVVVACRRRALDVVHRLGEVVDAERDRGGEQRRDVGEPGEDLGRGQRQVQPELPERVRDRFRLHVVAPPEHGRHPADHDPGDHRRKAARDPAGQPDVRRPGDQHDRERDERDPGHLPHLERRPERDERDRDAGERAEHRRARRVGADPRADERAEEHDHADDEAPREPGLPGEPGVLRREVHRQHDHEHHDEHVRHARPVGHRRDVGAPLLLRQLVGEVRVVQVPERQRDAERRQDPPEHDVVGQLDHEQAEPGQHDHVQDDVREEAKEAVPVPGHPPPHRRCAVRHVAP